MTIDADGNELLGYAGILLGRERDELRPSRTGSLFLAYDLKRYKAEARAQVHAAVALLGGLGDRARAGDVAGVPLPADAAHGAAGARGRAARRRQSGRAQRPQGHRRARPPEPRVRCHGARGGRYADAPAPRHRRAQRACSALENARRAIGRSSTPPRTRSSCTTSKPAPSSTSTPRRARRSATRARSSAASTSARSAPASAPYTQEDAMELIARARPPARTCASNGTARTQGRRRCAGTRSSSSA